MELTEQFDIDLEGMTGDTLHREYVLTDSFFESIDSPVLDKGNVTARVDVRRVSHDFELTIDCDGVAVVPCDRCLDDVPVSIHTHEVLLAKLGDGDGDDDGIIWVDSPDGVLNVAWHLFESIALALPCKRVHPDGQCNEEMAARLHGYEAGGDGGGDGEGTGRKGTDPRWDALKELLNNNK